MARIVQEELATAYGNKMSSLKADFGATSTRSGGTRRRLSMWVSPVSLVPCIFGLHRRQMRGNSLDVSPRNDWKIAMNSFLRFSRNRRPFEDFWSNLKMNRGSDPRRARESAYPLARTWIPLIRRAIAGRERMSQCDATHASAFCSCQTGGIYRRGSRTISPLRSLARKGRATFSRSDRQLR